MGHAVQVILVSRHQQTPWEEAKKEKEEEEKKEEKEKKKEKVEEGEKESGHFKTPTLWTVLCRCL